MSASPSDLDDTPRDEDPSRQFEHTSFPDPEQSQLNTPAPGREVDREAYAAEWIREYNPKGRDKVLWEWVQEDFAGWGKREWDRVSNGTRRSIKLLLRQNGVLVTARRKGEGLPSQLARLLEEVEPSPWSDSEIQIEEDSAREDGRIWRSIWRTEFRDEREGSRVRFENERPAGRQHQNPPAPVHQPVLRRPQSSSSNRPYPTIELPEQQTFGRTTAQPTIDRPAQQQTRRSELPPVGNYQGSQYDPCGVYEATPTGGRQQQPVSHQPTPIPGTSFGRETSSPPNLWQQPAASRLATGPNAAANSGWHQRPAGTFRPQTAVQQQRMAGPRGPPPPPSGTPPGSGTVNINKVILDLMKAYPDKQKYHGSADDLDTSIRQFYEVCWKLGLGTHHYSLAFSNMLSDDAMEYYTNNLDFITMSFTDMVIALRGQFESVERSNASQEEWDETRLVDIKADTKNAGKSWMECFDIMFKRL